MKLLLYFFMPVLGITFQFIKNPYFLFSSRYPMICFLIGYTILIQELLLADYGIGMVNYTATRPTDISTRPLLIR